MAKRRLLNDLASVDEPLLTNWRTRRLAYQRRTFLRVALVKTDADNLGPPSPTPRHISKFRILGLYFPIKLQARKVLPQTGSCTPVSS